MSSSPAYSPLLSVWAFRHRCPTMPAADSCAVVNNPCEPFSPESRTPRRPPEVSPTAFATHPPDLPPRTLMAMDFAIIGSLVRPGRPPIWFLFVRSWLCYTLPSDPASRRRPCVSLVLHHHQVGQGTRTPKLLCMLGAPKKTPHEAGQTSLRDVARTETTFATPERISRDTHRPNQTGPNTVALCQLSTDPSRVLRRLHRDAAGRHPWTPLSEEQLVRAVFRTLQIAAVGIALVAPAAHRRFPLLILIRRL